MSATNHPDFFKSLRFRYGLGLVGFLVVAGFFLWEEHEAHILGFVPLVLLLGACVGMHVFMHGGHGHRGHGDGGSGRSDDADDAR